MNKHNKQLKAATQLGWYVNKITKSFFNKQGFAQNYIIENWEAIVGPVFSEKSLPIKLHIEKIGGYLVIACDGSTAIELEYLKEEIIEKDGKLSMILGSPGGPTIITSVLQTILNVYLFNDNLKEAVDHPRFHHLWLPDKIYFEEGAFNQTIIDSLKIIGYNFNSKTSSIGRVDAIYIDQNKKIYAAADPRGDDYASGE